MVTVRVWDLPLRLFHWLLALLVAFSLVTGQFGGDLGILAAQWHMLSGYAVLTLLLFRLAWGFIGGTHARFASFVRGPRAVFGYLAEMTGRRTAQPRIGHNPLGGWSTLALLASLAAQAGSGLFLSDEDLGVEGPLAKYAGSAFADRLAALHEANFLLLLALVSLHIGAIAYYAFVKGDNLVRPMISGVKQVPSPPVAAGKGGHPAVAVVVLGISAGIVWYIVNRL